MKFLDFSVLCTLFLLFISDARGHIYPPRPRGLEEVIWRDCWGDINIKCTVELDGKKTALTGITPLGLDIQVKAPLNQKEATQEILTLFRSLFDVKPSKVEISRGHKSEKKVFKVLNTYFLRTAEIRQAIINALEGP